jgi:two-component system, OmpR family, phosphate regulon sensor histidine kinase PhoR
LNPLHQLAAALLEERDTILVRWRDRVRGLPSAAKLDVPTLNDHIPGWIVELSAVLLSVTMEADDYKIASPLAHGVQRFEDGFDIEEVVAEYNILRDGVHDLAESRAIELRGGARRLVNRVFDDAIGYAVKAFAESQAREVQRRRAEHLAFVAHDLRTPLSAITFSAHLLEQRLSETQDAEMSRLLRTLGRNAKQLDGLVTSVLKENTQLLTELGIKLERRTFDLWPVVELLCQDLQPVAAKSSTRLVNQVPDDLEVRADANLLRRVFQNLVANAIAYTPMGQVTIGARDPGPDLPIECWVCDNGKGIPRDRLDKVFDALETDPQRDGVGLGLAIVKTFVEAHDGRVSVESIEGQGSTFRFTLPRETAALGEAAAIPAERAAPLNGAASPAAPSRTR